MNDSPEKISPLRRRMIEDMRMRKLSIKTQSTYIRAIRHFAGYETTALYTQVATATLRKVLSPLEPNRPE